MAFPTAINDQITDAIAARHAQITKLQAEIGSLQTAANALSGGKTASAPTSTPKATPALKAKRGRTPMSDAARRAVSVRMKASWEKRRKAASAPTPQATRQPVPKTTAKTAATTRTGRKPLSAAARRLMSEKLKAYWANRKRTRR